MNRTKIHFCYSAMLLFYVLLPLLAHGQANGLVDTLLKRLEKPNLPDTAKVNALIKLGSAYYGANPKKMLDFAQQATLLAEKVGYQQGLAQAYRQLGIAQYTMGNFEAAEKGFSSSLLVNRKMGDQKGIAACLSNLGSVNMVRNNYPVALDYYQKAIRISDGMNDQLSKGISYGNMGVIYSELQDYDMALKHFQGGLAIHQQINYGIGIATALGNIGNVYFKQKNFAKALDFYQQSLDRNIKLGLKFNVAREYGNLANTQTELRDYDSAFENYAKALEMNEDLKNKKGVAVNLQGIANYYFLTRNYQQAINYALRANVQSEEINIFDVQKESFNTLADSYEKLEKADSAYYYYRKFVAVKDKIEGDANRKQVTRLQLKYEFDTKEEKYKTAQLLANERLNQQQLMLSLNQAKLIASNKERDLVRLNYLKTQAELQNQRLQQKAQDKQLTLVQKEKAIQEQRALSLLQDQKLKALHIKQLWLYGIIAIIGVVAVLSFVIHRLRIASLTTKNELGQQKAHQLQAETQMKSDLREAEMQTLRSQMNPHFIFNTLNSINSYIIQSRSEAASGYLTTFSKLMRNVLELSRNKSITLQAELQTLELYLQLEALRLENKFSYTIALADGMEVELLRIPPLIIQPFVENAIWHGLHNKANSGHLLIGISELDDGLIKIVIEDDGVGRLASSKLKQGQNSHKSYGIDITIHRIRMLNEANQVKIIDLYDQEKAVGTRIEIFLNT
ncbi:tetratricopeptide repeat-containing sensor histidine kinase [Nubsella zeaxanthinifaciens]|uniref:tetratricopeptide repeat-containing sensor histidine kinase n=1 Tax=Nubsella zeaxanthinifaciens TaxID=392412 RepID=UPI000DE1FBC0|nr:tetratricopeptide repeat protein [Nubsella zeaxanthinifaciens]